MTPGYKPLPIASMVRLLTLPACKGGNPSHHGHSCTAPGPTCEVTRANNAQLLGFCLINPHNNRKGRSRPSGASHISFRNHTSMSRDSDGDVIVENKEGGGVVGGGFRQFIVRPDLSDQDESVVELDTQEGIAAHPMLQSFCMLSCMHDCRLCIGTLGQIEDITGKLGSGLCLVTEFADESRGCSTIRRQRLQHVCRPSE